MEKDKDFELNLKKLFFYIVRYWRIVLCLGILISAVLLVKKVLPSNYASNLKATYDKQMNTYNKENNLYLESKESMESEMTVLEDALDNQKEYLKNSVLMNINPYNKATSTASILVDTGYQVDPSLTLQNIDYTAIVLNSYIARLNSGNLYDYVMDKMDIELPLNYFTELLTFTPDYLYNMITISVAHTDPDTANVICGYIYEYLESCVDEINNSVHANTITLVSRSDYYMVDRTLETTQTKQQTTLSTYEEQLATLYEDYSALSAPAKPATVNNSSIRNSRIIFSVLYIIVGFAISFIIVAIYKGIVFLFSNSTKFDDDVLERFGLPYFGRIRVKTKKRIFSKVDEKIDEICSGMITDEDESIKLVAANIKCAVKDDTNIALIYVNRKTVSLFTDKLLSEAKNENLNLLNAGNVLVEASAVKTVSNCECAVIVINKTGTTYSNIIRELNAVTSLNKNVIGYICI